MTKVAVHERSWAISRIALTVSASTPNSPTLWSPRRLPAPREPPRPQAQTDRLSIPLGRPARKFWASPGPEYRPPTCPRLQVVCPTPGSARSPRWPTPAELVAWVLRQRERVRGPSGRQRAPRERVSCWRATIRFKVAGGLTSDRKLPPGRVVLRDTRRRGFAHGGNEITDRRWNPAEPENHFRLIAAWRYDFARAAALNHWPVFSMDVDYQRLSEISRLLSGATKSLWHRVFSYWQQGFGTHWYGCSVLR